MSNCQKSEKPKKSKLTDTRTDTPDEAVRHLGLQDEDKIRWFIRSQIHESREKRTFSGCHSKCVAWFDWNWLGSCTDAKYGDIG